MTTMELRPVATTDTINAIVARYPAALPVLQRFGLDTCCGGALPLATAAAHHGLNVQVVLEALEALRRKQEQAQ
jgi:iron-sulfur cluster repair protein YtfE (RIC family)